MKLILLIILIIFGFQSSAWGQAPTLSIEAKQEPIQEIMKKIEHQTGRHSPTILLFSKAFPGLHSNLITNPYRNALPGYSKSSLCLIR